MWVLLFVYLYDEVPYVEKHSQYVTLMECFQGREDLGAELSGRAGYFPDGQQALCVKKI